MAIFGTTFGYTKGELLLVKLEAHNAIGYSVPSDELTSGLIFKTIPVTPVNFNAVSTAADTIVLSWDQITTSPDNGYSDVTSYEVWWDNADAAGSIVYMDDNGTYAVYTVTGLTRTYTYRFAVLARNKYGPSPLTDAISILSAYKPQQLDSVSTTEVDTGITFTWTATSDDRGSAVTAYRLNLLNKDTDVYSEYVSL